VIELLREAGEPGLRLTHTYRAAYAAVFQAWTEPDALGQWMCPPGATVAEVELDLRVGGAFRIVMRAGTTDVVHTGEYLEIRPPERLRFTWRSPNTLQQLTLVTVELFDEGGATRLVLTQQRLPAAAVEPHQLGWRGILENLARFLDTSSPDGQQDAG
jgi:uncharacterized protein YndB with AHSA1/START domain